MQTHEGRERRRSYTDYRPRSRRSSGWKIEENEQGSAQKDRTPSDLLAELELHLTTRFLHKRMDLGSCMKTLHAKR